MNCPRSCQIKWIVPFAAKSAQGWIQSKVVDTSAAIWKKLLLLLCPKFTKNGNSIPIAPVTSLRPDSMAINALILGALYSVKTNTCGGSTSTGNIVWRSFGAAERPLLPPVVWLSAPRCFSIICCRKDIWNLSTLSAIGPAIARCVRLMAWRELVIQANSGVVFAPRSWT